MQRIRGERLHRPEHQILPAQTPSQYIQSRPFIICHSTHPLPPRLPIAQIRYEGSKHTLLGDLDIVTHLASLASDLDTVVQELLKRGGVKDIVGGGDRVVDVELVGGLAGGSALLGGGGFGLFD